MSSRRWIAAVVLVASACGSTPVAVHERYGGTIVEGGACEDGPGPSPRAIRDAPSFAAFVATLPKELASRRGLAAANPDALLRRPALDFGKHMLVVSFARRAGEEAPALANPRREGERLVVDLDERAEGEFASPCGARRYRAIVVDATSAGVVFRQVDPARR